MSVSVNVIDDSVLTKTACSQCGKPYAVPACGPTHAAIQAYRLYRFQEKGTKTIEELVLDACHVAVLLAQIDDLEKRGSGTLGSTLNVVRENLRETLDLHLKSVEARVIHPVDPASEKQVETRVVTTWPETVDWLQKVNDLQTELNKTQTELATNKGWIVDLQSLCNKRRDEVKNGQAVANDLAEKLVECRMASASARQILLDLVFLLQNGSHIARGGDNPLLILNRAKAWLDKDKS